MTAVVHFTSQFQACLGILAVDSQRATISIPLANVNLEEAEAMLEKALTVVRAARAVMPKPEAM